MLKVAAPYDILQFCVSGTTHRENEVIALQSKCPQSLGLKEFLKFGSLRAGHRLQMRNLLDAVETRSLSFNNSSVHFLIAQSLWQLGPLNDANDLSNSYITSNFIYPASHSDFGNVEYLEKLYEIISNYLEVSSKCWTDHLILLNVITVTARAIAISPNDDMKSKMVKLMRRCREIGNDWIECVQNAINNSSCFGEAMTKDLKTSLLEICCFNILTYYVDKNNLGLLMNSDDDIVSWFISMSYIFDHKITFDTSNNKYSLHQYLDRNVKFCKLNIEEHFYNILSRTNNKAALTTFINKHWSDASQGTIGEWYNILLRNGSTLAFDVAMIIKK